MRVCVARLPARVSGFCVVSHTHTLSLSVVLLYLPLPISFGISSLFLSKSLFSFLSLSSFSLSLAPFSLSFFLSVSLSLSFYLRNGLILSYTLGTRTHWYCRHNLTSRSVALSRVGLLVLVLAQPPCYQGQRPLQRPGAPTPGSPILHSR